MKDFEEKEVPVETTENVVSTDILQGLKTYWRIEDERWTAFLMSAEELRKRVEKTTLLDDMLRGHYKDLSESISIKEFRIEEGSHGFSTLYVTSSFSICSPGLKDPDDLEAVRSSVLADKIDLDSANITCVQFSGDKAILDTRPEDVDSLWMQDVIRWRTVE